MIFSGVNFIRLFTLCVAGFLLLFFTACGGGEESIEGDNYVPPPTVVPPTVSPPTVVLPTVSPPPVSYTLETFTDDDFNALGEEEKYIVADKLLSSMFFGYPLATLQEKIDSGTFISSLQTQIYNEKTDKVALENYIKDPDIFYRDESPFIPQESYDVSARLYAAPYLDSYFFNLWSAYILTQTIMFSPAYELDSVHMKDIAIVYDRLIDSLENKENIQEITYNHMISQSNWRRFRSPEDNGREMLELFLFDFDDAHVPIAGQALQNWSLVQRIDNEFNILVIDPSNENNETLELFDTNITNGESFYRALVNSKGFNYGVTKRLVDFFFTEYEESMKATIASSIVESGHEHWQAILAEILFSKEYLLNNARAKSAEELFFSLAKKMEYKHTRLTIRDFCTGSYQNLSLEDMNQASMKYKLGKLTRVPLDTLSFATYHKTIRDNVLYKRSNPAVVDNYGAWDREGWSDSFIDNSHFLYDSNDEKASLESLINYLFVSIASRKATDRELELFRKYMLDSNNSLLPPYRMFYVKTDDETREEYKRNIVFVVLDYISRLDTTYLLREVK